MASITTDNVNDTPINASGNYSKERKRIKQTERKNILARTSNPAIVARVGFT
jgi:hypothetical protein